MIFDRHRRRAVLRLALGLSLIPLTGCASRQDEVAAKGREVMPFDLERTTHRFTPRDDGLLQEVRADDPADTRQIELVREHLQEEAERFRTGDFGDPAQIHGADMPGLAALEADAGRIEVTYQEIPAGAAIRFRTDDPDLVQALHAWGEAQVADHGEHAESGH